ncbi:MAG: bifunctional methionine sulfoxide reductase B/A protein [Planctomycetota bacterium]
MRVRGALPARRPNLSGSGHDVRRLSEARIAELAERLSDEEREVLLRRGTERPFCGNLLDNKKDGFYACRLCGLPLFGSSAKFDSGTGWPSFFAPVDDDHVAYIVDESHGMRRVEIVCARCEGHLGHVFDDGPAPTGRRYCLNSVSMSFVETDDGVPELSKPAVTETAYFGGGCFWGVEDRFQSIEGVIDAASGYQGGSEENPSYREVCNGTTGHAEVVRVVFDPAVVTYAALLDAFFAMHNPTTRDRQGPDVGTQYRSAIYTTSAAQLDAARSKIAALEGAGAFGGKPIVTEVRPVEDAGAFYEAEEYHQDYNARHGRSCSIG